MAEVAGAQPRVRPQGGERVCPRGGELCVVQALGLRSHVQSEGRAGQCLRFQCLLSSLRNHEPWDP